MDDDKVYKEVDFKTYCQTCKYKDLGETDDPCSECMDNSLNLESRKPIKWEDKDSRPKLPKKEPNYKVIYNQLDKAYKELDSSHKELNNAHEELNSSYKELDSSYKKLDTSYKELDNSYAELNDSHNELNTQFDQLLNQVDEAIEEFDDAIDKINGEEIGEEG